MINHAVDLAIVKLFFYDNFYSKLSLYFTDYGPNDVFISNV